MRLFFRECLRREELARADRIEDVAVALSKDGQKTVKKLRGAR
jgi:hypothetical protein